MALDLARGSRYPAVLLLGLGEQVDVSLWQDFAQENGLAFVDVLEEAQKPEFRQRVGAWPTLVEWVRAGAVSHGGIFVFDLDALVTRWSPPDRERFYLKLLKSETRADGHATPIVAISRLGLEQDLPDDHRNYGVVVDLLD